MPAVKNMSELLAGVPKGAWAALSRDESRVVAFSVDIDEAIKKAKEAGESEPIVVWVPEKDSSWVL